MQTRNNGKHVAGFYTKIASTAQTTPKPTSYENSPKIKRSDNEAMKGFSQIINSINFIVIKNLKKTKNPLIKANIEIDLKFKNFLVKNFDVRFRFKKINKFLTYFNI